MKKANLFLLMIFSDYNFSDDVSTVLSFFTIMTLMVLMLVLYLKFRFFHIILIVFLFSIVIGMYSIADYSLPFSPYFQLFFLTFQSVIFILTSNDYSNFKKGNKNE